MTIGAVGNVDVSSPGGDDRPREDLAPDLDQPDRPTCDHKSGLQNTGIIRLSFGPNKINPIEV